jgi:hypothetical protein
MFTFKTLPTTLHSVTSTDDITDDSTYLPHLCLLLNHYRRHYIAIPILSSRFYLFKNFYLSLLSTHSLFAAFMFTFIPLSTTLHSVTITDLLLKHYRRHYIVLPVLTTLLMILPIYHIYVYL